MDAADVMGILEAKGKPNTVKIYRRHGVSGESFGVSYGDLEKLVKQIGIDQALALALWRTRNHDARVLATKIADPMRMTRKQIETWIGDAGDHVITAAVATVAARMPDALDMARAWIASPDELVSAAGWQIMGTLGLEGGLAGEDAEPLIAAIRAGIHDAPNRTRYSMNNALIAIGGGMESMRAAALAAAKAIGTVYVDHGQTGCKTPDATSYIQRMIERAAKKKAAAAKPAAKKAAAAKPAAKKAAAAKPAAKKAAAATKQPSSRQQG